MKVYDSFIENNEKNILIVYVLIDNKAIYPYGIEPNDFLDLELLQEIDFENKIEVFENCSNLGCFGLLARITKNNIEIEEREE